MGNENERAAWRGRLLNKYETMLVADDRHPVRMFGIECGDGWRAALEDLFEKLYAIPGVDRPGFEITQVKEKFGRLCVYCDGETEETRRLVSEACERANKTCESCGTEENVGRTSGWIATCCKKCHESYDKMRGREWLPIGGLPE